MDAADMSSPAVVGNARTCIHRVHQSVLKEYNSTFVYVQETFQFKVAFDPGSGFSAIINLLEECSLLCIKCIKLQSSVLYLWSFDDWSAVGRNNVRVILHHY